MIAKTTEKIYPVDVGGCLPLQMMDFNISFQPIISDWPFVGLYASEPSYITPDRCPVVCRAHARKKMASGLKLMFCYNDFKEAVGQSISALCLVNLLKTMVVGSSPDDGSLVICFVYFYFFLLPSAASLAEIIQYSHLFSQENCSQPQKRLVVDVLDVDVHCVAQSQRSKQCKVQNSALNSKPEAGIAKKKCKFPLHVL